MSSISYHVLSFSLLYITFKKVSFAIVLLYNAWNKLAWCSSENDLVLTKSINKKFRTGLIVLFEKPSLFYVKISFKRAVVTVHLDGLIYTNIQSLLCFL